MENNNSVLLEMKNICKSFPGVKALDNVSLTVKRGTVHALMGENGAGKSTLMKCLFGIYSKDSGQILLNGKEVSFKTSKEALEHGVAMVHQELNQALKRNVMDNIWLGRYPTVGPFTSEKKMLADTAAIFDDLGIHVDPRTIMSTMPVAQRQMVEIAKAVSYHSDVIVFDEPTSSLTEEEVEHLFRIINMLRDRGCGIIYISHKMEEILRISDEVTVMRDGAWVATEPAAEMTMERIIKLMVGRELTNRFPPKDTEIGGVLLQMAEYPNKMFPGIGTVPVPIVILAVIAIGALVGAVNGFCTAKFNLHPFIVTLATQLIVYGTLLIYLMQGNNNGQSISGLDKSYTNLITGSILSVPDGKGNMVPIPNFVWYAIVITVVMWFVWNKTTFGKNMFAVGSNPEAANVSGVNVAATTILVFTLAGVMYGFTGFIEGARIGANTANTGLNYELDAIAACVIGGVSFVGGIGKIRGVIIGVVLLRIIFVGLTFMSVSSNLQYIIKGLIILVACAIDMRKYLVRK